MCAKPIKNKKKAASKLKEKKHNPALNPTFRLVWKDSKTGEEGEFLVGTMMWRDIGVEDALELEELIGKTITKYFRDQLKKKVKKHAK